MYKTSKLLFIMLLALAATLFSPFNLFAVESPLQQFPDVPTNHPFVKTISDLKEKGYVKGYADGTFSPDSSITRAEFVTMLLATTGRPTVNLKDCFKDVRDEWFAPFVCAAKKKGLVKGYAGGTFGPHKNINFAEASAVIAQAHALKPRKAAAGEVWYKPAVTKLAAKSAIPVTIDFPEKKMSRGETAEILWRLKTGTTDKPTKTFKNLTAEFPNLSSCDELKEKLQLYQYRQGYGRGYGYMKAIDRAQAGRMEVMEMQVGAAEAEAMEEPASVPVAAPPGSPDYSTTNVQVEGVDEADVIKNDGEFIYMVSGNKVRIVKAYPPENMAEVSRFEFSDNRFHPSDMYVESNKLVVLGSTYLTSPAQNTDSSAPIFSVMKQKTEMFIIDISNRSAPREERVLHFDGYQISSRRIGNLVYLVLRYMPNDYIQATSSDAEFPDDAIARRALPNYSDSRTMTSDKPIAPCSKIKFLPKYDKPDFLAVVSVDVQNPEKEVSREVIMGAGETVYASPESLYVAATRYDVPEIEQFDVWQPPSYGPEKTVFHRFSLANGEVKFKTQGEVSGHLLNQFSMDEEGNAFRAATTVERGNGSSQNNLFILDRENLNTVLGKIENIASGEKIYSVRFLGKRAYMVTFKKIDPFFVIDVEDPKNPKILGELKIPGYSDYLHPFDENHIIGFGKEAVDPTEFAREGFNNNAFDFAWYQGMKIALFDVTDVGNPKLLFKEVIGDRGTESELFYNHKVLLHDKKRSLFAFPVSVAEIKDKKSAYTGSAYGKTIFQGAYVYNLDLEKGFELQGKITHYEDLEKFKDPHFYWYSDEDEDTIQRVIYIGDYLYTISLAKVKATLRDTMQEVKTLKFEQSLIPPEPVIPIY